MQGDIDQVLIPREEIAQRVRRVAEQITADLVGPDPAGDGAFGGPERVQITLIPILTGSFMFVADLIRHLPLYMRINLVSVSSYPGASTASRGARLNEALTSLPESLAGQHVLVIDDILDSGSTLRLVNELLARRRPASLRTCVLLRKRRPQAMAVPVQYVCFDIPDAFVVGYGLDFDGYYRNLPDIVTLRPHVIENARTAGGVAAGQVPAR
jgi:hypoxanthine phosphoribosyltransferase